MILVMGMLAFIVNVGLFVKAKINLQNAVDAAAYSGAATQARQLTNIAYVNWELRNTFKEWMFKYYVLGQLGLAAEGANPPYNLTDGRIAGNGQVNFLLRTPATAVLGTSATSNFDAYNAPSICVHNNSSTNICPLYALPGIPRFPAIGVAGISEIHEAFVNKLVEEKGANCSARTQINFLAAMAWAYSSGIKDMPGAPIIATNRPGAWTQALELAMRMRNLEMLVNRPPVETPINIQLALQLQSQLPTLGYNERPIKAYASALRNLGGGKYKDNMTTGSAGDGEGRDELALNFKLTEIAPQPFEAQPNSVSGFLIPQTFSFQGSAVPGLRKHYLDLQVIMLNYSTLFTTFATTRNEFDSSVDSEASCFVSKTALPVPGYIMGFTKNPSVMTYYAVKGESEFTGLFFPRNSDDQPGSFPLTAYAAAKPYGGRIGPRLFSYDGEEQGIIPRLDQNRKSNSYISGLNTGSFGTNFVAGMPIPSAQSFWAQNSLATLGGIPDSGAGSKIAFGIPNMIYDIEKEDDLTVQSSTFTNIQILDRYTTAPLLIKEDKGLFSAPQFRALKKSMGTAVAGVSMTGESVLHALIKSRRVTNYDVVNYLVPDYRDVSGTSNAAPFIQPVAKADNVDDFGYVYRLFAPLAGDGLLYSSGAFASSIAASFRVANEAAVNAYLDALKQVGQAIFNLPSQGGSSVNLQAAQSIHINTGPNFGKADFPPMTGDDPNSPTCPKDMASKFNHFFKKSVIACGIVPLENLIAEYIDKQMQGDGALFYRSTYYNDNEKADKVMTAYHPGPRQGAVLDNEATATHPLNLNISGSAYSTLRNSYSTKFIQLAKVMNGAGASNSSAADYLKEPLLKESLEESPEDLIGKTPLKNAIDAVSLGLNNPYFLDF